MPRRCETLITLSYQCQLPFNLSMNHFSRIHCVTETRDWEEFTDFVYSCCQVNVNVKVSVSAGMGGVVTLRSVTCSLDYQVLNVSSSLGCTHSVNLQIFQENFNFVNIVNLQARWFAHS